MFGSLYYNCWIALLSFTIYFLARFQTTQAPLSIILFGLLWALIAFIVTFILRAIIGYILFTPESEEEEVALTEEEQKAQQDELNLSKTSQPKEENAEEIAQVVQTMLLKDEK